MNVKSKLIIIISSAILHLIWCNNVFGTASLVHPKNNSFVHKDTISFSWNESFDTAPTTYELNVATDTLFNDVLINSSGLINSDTSITNLTKNQKYFWRIRYTNINGTSDWSSTWSFTYFDPGTISSINLWLSGDKNVVQSGGIIDAWNDRSGQNNNATQGNNANKPGFIANALNGLPGISFNGSSTFLTIAKNNWGSNVTIASVVKLNNINTVHGIFDCASNLNFSASKGFRFDVNNTNYRFGVSAASNLFNQFGTTNTNFHIRVSGFNSSQIIQHLNTSPRAPSNLTGNIDYTGVASSRIGNMAPANNYLNGIVSEIMIFNEYLADSNRIKVENYLRFKYFPPVNLGKNIKKSYGLCNDTISAGSNYVSYSWSTGTTTSSIIVTQSGTYSVTVTDLLGFTSRDTIIIEKPALAPFPVSNAVCLGAAETFSANLSGNYEYLWSNSQTTQAIQITQEGNYNVTVTDDFGCSATSNTFFVDIDSFKTFISLGNDTNLCAGNIIGLFSGSSLVSTYSWSTGATTETIEILSSDDYAVTVTNSAGCSAADTMYVDIVGQAPVVYFEADIVCAGIPTTFDNQSELVPSYLWNFGAATTTDINPEYTFPATGTYAVTLTATTSTGCSAFYVKDVLVRPNPVASFQLPYDACVGNAYALTSSSTVPNPDSFVDIHWNFGDGNTASGANVSNTYNSIGQFDITLAVNTFFGCTDTASLPITVIGTAAQPSAPLLLFPYNGFVSTGNTIAFIWAESLNTTFYTIQIAEDSLFSNIILNESNVADTFFVANGLPEQVLYWRVLSNNICGDIVSSDTLKFTIFLINAIPSLELWLAADTGVVLNSGSVSQWSDLSGQNNHALQSDIANRPTLSSNSINNLPTVTFNGTSHFLTIAKSNWGDRVTIMSVVRVNNNTSVHGVFDCASSVNFGASKGFRFDINSNTYRLGISATSNVFNQLATATSKFHIRTASFNNSQIRQYINTIAGAATNLTGNIDYTGIVDTRIGNMAPSNNFLNGNIAELFVFSDTIPNNARMMIETYLRFKYAPPVNLGPDINVSYGFCDASLNATKDYFESYKWSTGDTTPTLNIRNSGTYSITVTDIFGFTSSDTINITIPQRPSLTGGQIICQDTPETFDVNLGNGYVYVWNATDSSNIFTTDTAGVFFYTIYDTINCFFSDTITVSVDSFKTYLSLGDDTSLCSNNKIGIADTGSYAISSYAWSTNETTPFATINLSGNYSITATNSNGCIGTDVVFVHVLGVAPVVGFTTDNFCLGDTTQFNDASTVSGSSPTAWAWDFGDSTTASIENPTHTFQQATDYYVTLEVTTASGCKEKITDTISIYPLPVANFTNELSCAGTSTQFNDASTILGINQITSWDWNFDGDTATDRYPVYTFPGKGEYDVSISVTSDKGCSSTITKTVEVFNELIADFSTGTLCFGDSARFFDETNSLSIIKYEWEFGDGRTSSAKNPANMYLTTGGYNVTLKVTNAIGCISEKQDSINIFESPIADFTFNGVCLGNAIQFIDATNARGDSVIRQFWNFGDGFQTITATNPYYQYDSAATYTIWHRVLTANGCTDTVTKQVTIQLPPVADFSFTPDFGAAPLVVNFTNESSADATDFFWTFTENPTDTTSIENPEFTFTLNTTYNITLTTYSADGCVDAITKSIKVAESILDIAVTNVTVSQDLMDDGNYKVITVAEITNVGTRDVKSFDIQSKISNNIALQETWEGNLPFGTKINYVFDASYIAASEENKTFICIEAIRPNNEADENPADNRNCIALENNIKVLPIYPNPSRDNISLDIILPKDGKVTVTIYSALGAQLTALDNDLKKGFNSLNFNVKALGKGVYILKTTFEEETDVQKFMVE